MSYQALYRVWRPQTFKDVVGQEHITKTLQNALMQQKISHAYLFSGPRGTGKTSAAKILAKAVNCEKAPTKEPCNQCPSCIGITEGSIADVIEIDAASNNGVDEIRDIRDKVKYAPSTVKYKVYIIDEVHMLSIGAFNALLKTLEEPPSHVIFILATTEPHKIPLTILSRCQRFEFKRISSSSIVERMKYIVKQSGVDCDEKALQIIARSAEGGMRDALSLLDQTISFSQDKVTIEDALTVTGSVSQSLLNQIALSIAEKDVASGLEALDELIFQGKDPLRFIEDFILYYRDLLLYKVAPNSEQSLERVMIDSEFQSIVEKVKNDDIYQILEVLNDSQQEMRRTNNPRIFLEVAIIKLCQLENKRASSEDITQLIKKVEALERQIQHLQANGIKQANVEHKPISQKPKIVRRGYEPPVEKIYHILKHATKEDLRTLQGKWGEMLTKLIPSHAALLKEAEVVAASKDAFVVKFTHEIHCQMAMERTDFLGTIPHLLFELTGKNREFVGVPGEKWLKIREDFLKFHRDKMQDQEQVEIHEEDPVVTEAIKIFGNDLIEIKD